MKSEELGIRSHGKRYLVTLLLGFSFVYGEAIDDALDGFDEAPATTKVQTSDIQGKSTEVDALFEEGFDEDASTVVKTKKSALPEGLTGELSQKLAYSPHNDSPYDGFNMFQSELFLDYEHKFDNGYKFKINAKAFYDAIYSLKGREEYSDRALKEMENEVELFDAYVEGKLASNFDFKIGRQVVVWGRSDTIRITDILNPLDNRLPGMTDIEDLRLPVGMAKFDYFVGNWRVTPIVVLEQRFSKNPPFGGDFYPASFVRPEDTDYNGATWALSVGGEFEGWDINFYAADVRDDAGYIDFLSPDANVKHDKVRMYGTALNILSGSWLFKTELAHFQGLKYTSALGSEFDRTDALMGVEYNGIADTMISYDISLRTIHDYDARLLLEMNPLKPRTYQQALRISSDFFNATLEANYLISLFGKNMDEGGYQRLWVVYDVADGISLETGVVDYIGGSSFYDRFKNNDRVFATFSYSF